MAIPGPSQFIQFLKGWRASLPRVIALWQQQRPNAAVGYQFLWTMIVQADIVAENLLQGINDWAPGSPDATATALPLIAQSRGLIQGEAEANAHFAGRLINWRTNGLPTAPPATPKVGNQTGNSRVLAQQIQQFLGNTPMVRVIERLYSTGGTPQARYITANTDGTISDVVAAWDWDSVSGWTDDATTWSGAQTRGFWSDFWVVIYPSTYPKGTSVTPLSGQVVPKTSRDAILRIVGQWKGIHTFCRAIIWSYNAALFDPASPGTAGNPDGTWGNWSHGSVPARNLTDARYWIPAHG